MDGWNAPMWVDFDASVMSDIDEYFNVQHDELESEQAAELQYHSCPSTPNSKSSIAGSPYKTPKSGSNGSSRELSDYMKTLQINAVKKLSKSKLSMTPRNYVLKKACLRSTTSSTPRISGKDRAKPRDVEEKENKSPEAEENILQPPPIEPAAEDTKENLEPADEEDDGEDENAEQNRTLVATAETDQSCTDGKQFFATDKVCTKDESETTKEIQDSQMAKESQDRAAKNSTDELSMTRKREDSAPTKLIDDSSMEREGGKSATTTVRESGAGIAPERANEKVSIDSSSVKNSDEVSPPSTKNDQRADKVNEPEKKLTKSQSRVDPSRRVPLECKKIMRNKPTVLTSHARRQSTSKYRRVSGKYVSLAEAVSRFQNGTPERFRSSNKPRANSATTGAAAVAGPLQKMRHASLKLTCATSPLLRCKYRARTVSQPSKEEREILEIEEIRKNRLKPNPIKPSIMKPSKKLPATTIAKPGPSSKPKKPEIISGASKKIDEKKPARNQEAVSSTDDPARPLKKSVEPTTVDGDASTRFERSMKPLKTSDRIKKPTATASDIASVSRRTMINPPKLSRKINEPTTSGSLLSSRRTMTNPSTPLNKIDKRPTSIPEPFSISHKAAFKPPNLKKSETDKPKTFAEPFPVGDKKKDTSILSTSMLPESARKHTPCKKTVPTVVSTDEGAAIKDVEILHFGIPVGNDYKKITKTVPFSFENRAKELRDKKEKLKNRQTEEPKKPKTFHARPVPSYVIKPAPIIPKPPSKLPVMPDAPFSFQQRNEILLSKKREMFEKMVEREKQARIFHAKPAPNFKPVFVRGASAENLRDNKFADKNDKITKETRRRGLSQSSIVENRENIAPNVPPTTQSFPKLKVPLVTQNRKLKKTAT